MKKPWNSLLKRKGDYSRWYSVLTNTRGCSGWCSASTYTREAAVPAESVGLLHDNPTFTFKGKIPVKVEEVKEVVKGVSRQGHRKVHRIWTVSDSKIKTEDKRKYRRIVRESSMPWDQAGYKAKLQKNLEDIRQKLNRVLGPDKRIEGSVLVDLCMQRSDRRESGCDAPNASEELPTPMASPPRSPTPPAAQVRQYSWRHYAKKEVCLYIHTLKPLKALQKSERENQQYSVIRDNAELSNSELNQLVHVPQYANNIHTLKPLKARKEGDDLKFKCPGSTSCQNHGDVIVNKPVARKQYAQKKHSLVSTQGFLKNTLNVCNQTFTKVALMLAVVISILGGVLNVKLPGRISTIGTSSLVCQECEC